jgi:hypothetical protein
MSFVYEENVNMNVDPFLRIVCTTTQCHFVLMIAWTSCKNQNGDDTIAIFLIHSSRRSDGHHPLIGFLDPPRIHRFA